MTKSIYETAGQFQLVGPKRGEIVPASRPAVLESSHFTQQFVGTGRLKVLAQVNDEATDAEFAKYWAESEGDKELAVASFVAAFAVEGTDPPAPPPKKPRAQKDD
jgi:hypothetical protein